MPKESISLYFTIEDGGSKTLTTLGNKTKALDKETQQLAQHLKALESANKPLISRQQELKSALETSGKTVADLRKEYRKLGDEASKDRLDSAIAEQDELKRSLAEVEDQLRKNQKGVNEYRETLRKGVSEGGGSGGSSGGLSSTKLATGLISGQVGSMLSSSIGGFAEYAATSALGTPAASMLSDAIGSAISGAVAGAVFGPLGIAIGAGVGAISGGISGATKIFEAEDDAFKEYYNGLHDTVNSSTDSMIESGSTIAGGREQTQRAFAQWLGGDEAADAYLERVKTMAAGTNYAYDEITGYSKLLLNTYDPEEVFGVLQTLSDASAGLNLSSSDVSVMISGLSRMRTTGKATQEYLNYFSERGVDVYAALADALGVDKSGIAKMVTGGDISGGTAAQAVLDYIDKTYGGLSEDLMSTYDAMTDNLEDIMSNIQAAGGEGYNEERKAGLEAESAAYEGSLGDAVSAINRIAGENQAYFENLSEQITRETLSAVLEGKAPDSGLYSQAELDRMQELAEQFQAASEAYADTGDRDAAVQMENIYEQAEALAQTIYDGSDQVVDLQNAERDQIAAIRDSITATENLTGALQSYYTSQEESKGMGSQTENPFGKGGFFDSLVGSLSFGLLGSGSGHAAGLRRVPYDDYPALLHENERVLTAAEARAMDSGGGGSVTVTVTGNNFVGTGEEMADQLMSLITDKLRLARLA